LDQALDRITKATQTTKDLAEKPARSARAVKTIKRPGSRYQHVFQTNRGLRNFQLCNWKQPLEALPFPASDTNPRPSTRGHPDVPVEKLFTGREDRANHTTKLRHHLTILQHLQNPAIC
jgi:hypothetical protein